MAKFHDPKTGKTIEAPNLKAALEKFKPKPKVEVKTETKPKPKAKPAPKSTLKEEIKAYTKKTEVM